MKKAGFLASAFAVSCGVGNDAGSAANQTATTGAVASGGAVSYLTKNVVLGTGGRGKANEITVSTQTVFTANIVIEWINGRTTINNLVSTNLQDAGGSYTISKLPEAIEVGENKVVVDRSGGCVGVG